MSVTTTVIKCVLLIVISNNRDKMGSTPVLWVVHAVTVGTLLKFNGGNNRHELKTLHVNRP